MVLPAKLRMPVVDASRLLQRTQLFGLLDGARDASGIWVSGPPGAGKTVLVQTWIQARQFAALWYRVDHSDADPATLPHYLRLAADGVAAGLAQRLPALTSDRRGNIEAFASDFFSPLFDAMTATSNCNGRRSSDRPAKTPVLVFDNIDEAFDSEPFARLLAAAVECVQPGAVRIVMIGRSEPGGPFARLCAHERLALLDGRCLRVTETEALELVALRRVGRTPLQEDQVLRLHSWCEGWISGLVLASAQAPDALPLELASLARDRVFPYLAATVLDRQPAAVRQLLLAAALLPTFSPEMAEAVAGIRGAGPILCRMAERNLFITVRQALPTRQLGESPVYQFHDLLREFLLARGRSSWGEANRRALLLRAAAALADDSQADAAAQALVEAEAWDALAKLVRAEAAAQIKSGRQQTLAGWLNHLPARWLAADPWLAYWDGQCKLLLDPPAGRVTLALALRGFEASDDLDGRILAWCSIVETIAIEWSDFSEFDALIEQADCLLRQHAFETLPAPLAPRFACAMLGALLWRQPGRADVEFWYECARVAVQSIVADGPRILAGMQLFHFTAVQWGNHSELGVHHARLRPRPGLAQLSPIEALLATILDASHAWLRGFPDQAVEHVRRGRELRDHYDIRLPGWMLPCHEIYALATAGRIDEATEALARARVTELDTGRQLDTAHADFQAALVACQGGRQRDALESIRAANRAVAVVGGPHQWCHGALAQAQILHELGDDAAARRCLAEGMRHQNGARCDIIEYEALACQALFDIDAGLSGADPLTKCFGIGARNDILNYIWFRPAMMARLCARALELGIETSYTLRLIGRRSLVPPCTLEAWPWPVKVYIGTAGAPRVLVDGHVLDTRRRAPDAPLRLLQGLVMLAAQVEPRSFNGHALECRPVERELLGMHLRPNADPGSNEDWLDQNVKRLRRRLGHGDAVLGFGGKLALNPLRVWVDVFVEAGRRGH